MKWPIICIVMISFFTRVGYGQIMPNANTNRWIKVKLQDTILVDTMSIDHVQIVGIPAMDYLLDKANASIIFLKRPPQDSVLIHYRVLPIKFTQYYRRKSIDSISTAMGRQRDVFYISELEDKNSESLVDFGNMEYNGALSRAVTLGNNQDLVLNSQFNLQMNGRLADSTQIIGSLTDNNIPFQPEGNTQNLQEFDRIFLQLKRNNSSLTAGDLEINKPTGYFMTYYKRVQGLMLDYKLQWKGWNYTQKISASRAKGKFIRNQITPIEGNQGPYKINGPNGEVFFILLANTEKIYIDGVLKERGENKDYVIDYNSAEIRFMPRCMITKDSRIIVEYEFNDRNYLNSLIINQNEWQKRNTSYYFNIYSNQDAKNQPFQVALTDSQKNYLATIGDQIQLAKIESGIQDTFSSSKIMYRRKDTMIDNIAYRYYVHEPKRDTGLYVVNFTFMGPGGGDYIADINLANGRVYKWIPPINGVSQGNFSATVPLVTPKRLQMFTAGILHKLSKSQTIKTEVGLSRNDPNLFSPIDNSRHNGLAFSTDYELQPIQLSDQWKFAAVAHYEFVAKRFQQLERFRNPEFTRDWNQEFNPVPASEHLGVSSIHLTHQKGFDWKYEFSIFNRDSLSNSQRHFTQVRYNRKKHTLTGIVNTVLGDTRITDFQFWRPSLQWLYDAPMGDIGIKCSLENNQIRRVDSLVNGSFGFEVAQMFWKSKSDKKNQYQLDYFTRRDQLPSRGMLKEATWSHNLGMTSTITTLKNQTLRTQVSLRQLAVMDTSLYRGLSERNVLGRIEYGLNVAKGAMNMNIVYEIGAGQDLKREFAYYEVPQGQGAYVWRDYNKDSIAQLNEFELAIFQNEKKYIRIYTPTNEYVISKYNIATQSITLSPERFFKKQSGMAYRIASKFFIQESSNLQSRLLGNDPNIYNPFYVSDDMLSSARSHNVSVYFNRMNTRWGMDYSYVISDSRSLLTYGIDERGALDHLLKARYTLSKRWIANMLGKNGIRYFKSPFLDGRTYNFSLNGIEPSIAYTSASNRFNIVTSGRIESRMNEKLLGGEVARFYSGTTNIRHSTANQANIQGRLSYNYISFNGDLNTSLGYNILDGLVVGHNILWQMGLERKLGKGMELAIDYEGRKPGANAVIHTGRASVRALF